MNLIKFIFIGIFFGVVLVKTEVISWFRIQEMFLFKSFHMYGIIGSAIVVGMISIQLLKRHGKDFHGNELTIKPKPLKYRAHLLGGTVFGLGWALTGACPGPMYGLLGGFPIMVVPLISAILGTLVYGLVRNKLPH